MKTIPIIHPACKKQIKIQLITTPIQLKIQFRILLLILQNIQSCVASNTSSVLLAIAVVQIYLGTFYPARALIDTGSEGSFITEQLRYLIG